MDIFHIMAAKGNGGAEKFFERLVIGLSLHNMGQHIAVKNPIFIDNLRQYCQTQKQYTFGQVIDIITDYQLARHQRRIKADIIMAWMSRAAYHIGRFNVAPSTPKVARLGGYYPMKYYKNIDYFVANTKDIASYLMREHVPSHKIRYISNFIDEVKGQAISPAKLGVPNGAKIIMSIGRLHPNKDFACAIKMMQYLPDEFHLIIVGSGPELSYLQRVAADANKTHKVHFLGWRHDTQDLLASADYYVSSACVEPLGNTILESWYQSTPVVATLSEGPSQYMEHGYNGLCGPIGDAKKLADNIMHYDQDAALKQRVIAQARQTYDIHYNKAYITEQYINFFHEIV